MGATGYSLDGLDWIPLPVGPRFGGAIDKQQEDLEIVTGRGVRWIYRLYDRDYAQLTFRCTTDDIADFENLHNQVDGQAIPFYFSLDITASPIVSIYGKKEKGFAKGQMQQAADEPFYDYVMTIIGEISPDSVDE